MMKVLFKNASLYRADGWFGAGSLAVAALIVDGMHVAPEAVRMTYAAKGTDGVK